MAACLATPGCGQKGPLMLPDAPATAAPPNETTADETTRDETQENDD